MALRIVFEHESAWECARAPAVESVMVAPNHEGRPARRFADYTVAIGNPPAGVKSSKGVVMASEADDLVPISALQHVVFCPRQAALIHVERIWQDNTLTVKGSILHEQGGSARGRSSTPVRVERAVALRSERLRAAGVADAVEYHRDDAVPGGFRPVPVEYKRGKVQQRLADQVQLCAQAMCLEEQHRVVISCGFLYYGESHRRSKCRSERNRAASPWTRRGRFMT